MFGSVSNDWFHGCHGQSMVQHGSFSISQGELECHGPLNVGIVE